jgi:hypothetical protein
MTKCKWYHCTRPRKLPGRGGETQFCSRSCKNKYHVQKRRIRIKLLAVRYLGGECEECHWVGPADGYDFHHRDPAQKDFTLSGNGHTRSWARTRAELDKCQLLCSRCHRLEHWKGKASLVIEEEVLREMENDPEGVLREMNMAPKAPARAKPAPKPRPTKIAWPSDEELLRLVWEKPRTKLSELLGVSNVAIGKRCRSRGIDQPSRGHWAKKKALPPGIEPGTS